MWKASVYASLLIAGLAVPGGWASAAEPAAPAKTPERGVAAALPGVLHELDSADFAVRARAAATIEGWLSQVELQGVLLAEFQRVLLDPAISYELRWRLEGWCRRAPAAAPQRATGVSAAELDRLMAQLDDDSYAVRLGAARRIAWLAGTPTLACRVMLRLKARMSAPGIPPEALRHIEPVWHEARGRWLQSDPRFWEMPAASDEQIAGWLDQVAQSERGPAGRQRSMAEWELRDVLAQDKYVERVKRLLAARQTGPTTTDGAARLKDLAELIAPGMVAEIWLDRSQITQQNLIVGVPQMAEGAMRPTFFDRIDEQVAHCVSGNTLTLGDYPVGVAFPHPSAPNMFFALINLPTPRRKMAYPYSVSAPTASRLAELTRRTMDRFLSRQQRLSEQELLMLEQLDAREVSRFAGKFFNLVDDSLALGGEVPVNVFLAGASRHATLCRILAAQGTKEAIPGLLDAIAAKRFLEPTAAPPYQLAWWAALSIAARDPWDGVDAWLAGLVDRTDLLIDGQADGPELGATAAAILLLRGREQPAGYGLRAMPQAPEPLSALNTYRFAAAEGRDRVRQWWQSTGKGRAQAKTEEKKAM